MLALQVWIEEEGFSGKRPFGNSGWQREPIRELVKAGAVPGKVTTEEYNGRTCEEVEIEDWRSGEKIIENAIRSMIPATAKGRGE